MERRDSILYAETFVPFLNEGVGACLWSMASPLLDQEGNCYGAIQFANKLRELARNFEDGQIMALVIQYL
jgi:hypothetical protein